MFTKQSKNKGNCDRCQIIIHENDVAICFHTDVEELYMCEACVEEVCKEAIKEHI